MNALVVKGDCRAAVAVVRSLGAAGIDVTVMDPSPAAVAFASRYCKRRVRCPDLACKPREFVDFLVDFLRREKHDVLIACEDDVNRLVHENRRRLSRHARLAIAPPEAMQAALDKGRALAVARRLGVAVPRSFTAAGPNSPQGNDYPVVLKDRWAIAWVDGRAVRGKVRFAADAGQLHRQLHNWAGSGREPMIQARIIGEAVGYFALCSGGRILARFQHRRIRQFKPTGSGSSLRISTRISDDVEQAAAALLRELRWDGLAMVEFKRDVRRGNIPVLMEINGRPWGSMALACYAGVDFPLMLYRYVRNRELPPAGRYRVGVCARWWAGELQFLENVAGGPPPGWRDDYPSLTQALGQVLTLSGPTRNDNLTLDDPAPGILELRRTADYLCRRIAAKLRLYKMQI